MRSNRIILINRYFHPDYSANSQLLADLAFALAADGKEVHAICCRQLYENPKAWLPSSELISGVKIHRIWTTQFGRNGLFGRVLDYASFYFSLARYLARLVKPGDIVVATTDPPLLSVLAANVARRRGSNAVNWLQDLYPEVAIQLGIPGLRGPLGRMLTKIRDHSLNTAKLNVVVGQRMADHLLMRGIDPKIILFIPNWADDEQIRPLSAIDNPVRKQWGLDGKFVVGYSGNLGRAHEYDTILAAAERLRDRREIVFVIIGSGHKVRNLSNLVQARGVSETFRFFPYQHRDLLKYSLNAIDLHLVSLKPEAEGLMFPSKFFGIAAAGKPMIAISSRQGELGELVERHSCGVVITPMDVDALVQAIESLSTDVFQAEKLGRSGRQMLEAQFSQEQGLQRWKDALS